MRIWRPITLGFQGLIVATVSGGVAVIGAMATPWGAWIGLVPALIGVVFMLRRSLRRWRTAQEAFPAQWRQWLEEHVPFYAHQDALDRRRFERDMQFVLAEQRFEAVGDVDVDEEVRLSVAAGAALLLHGRPDWDWPTQRTVLIYPDRFDDTYHKSDAAHFDGMIHPQGPIILSKRAIERSWSNAHDGDNVVLHELAHAFDNLRSGAAGMPSFLNPKSATSWRAIVQEEMEQARQGSSLLRPYAGSSPGELFAVAVENFFERPEQLRGRHPDLYKALSAFFNLDPLDGAQEPLQD